MSNKVIDFCFLGADNNTKNGGEGMIEKRKYMRFDVPVDIEYMVTVSTLSIEGTSTTKNLSREGMQLILDKDLPPGTEIDIKIRIPEDVAPIYAKGIIVWNDKLEKKGEPNVGIKFVQISPFDRNRILEHVYKEWVERQIRSKGKTTATETNKK
ncbi:MAG: hypothetical protein AMJ78_09240 [Omnitrophica WOR_2 bacterium SM23_29]|nr:MAG: hypothetical protein AMJ78_09240 [Omnitrophica WOR_2 bacterium SM23_29]